MNISAQSGGGLRAPQRTPLVIEGATPALGQASQAVKYGDVVFISGQLPIDPRTNKLVENEIGAQTEACIQSLQKICDFLSGALSNIVKMTIYIVAMEDLPGMEKVYKQYFSYQPPARTIVGVARLPMNARIQMDAIIYPPPREKAGSAF
ncbi:MAG TPA: Rid family detoxifying hydrolase [Candidatus Sumerlaeota bacterium]|nr:MAG: Enamine/imine deaminase [candidate division BRC1 bacterium ADurb.Bin183]HOE63590.1 Rid family detoxifying hydrolase [Candidatus Sumerlaeota bacterium]HRR30731.1 Rid family detoxifying hydrolase [Candidatus Sumerlaeia bacterium]HON50485.1 Rid family detoxifying hydrolase [Candidatus Sumerlaeota bacterium]HOR63701.1 Rid family detoxifying hydrolase [Candidatus Sumerlaeota bacterium]